MHKGSFHSEETKKKMREEKAKHLNGMFGKKHSIETRRKQSLSHTGKVHSEETKKKIGRSFLGKKLSQVHRMNIGSGNTIFWLDEAKREDQSKKMIDHWKDPVSRSLHCKGILRSYQDPVKHRLGGKIKGYFFSTKLNDNIPYRSSYELAYLKQLESDPLVSSYEYEPVRISYFFEGQKHTTIPDFLVHYTDGHTELVEVKANWCLNNLDVQARLEAMKKYAEDHDWTFRLVTKDALVNSI